MRKLLTIVLALCFMASCTSQKVNLRFNLKEGESYSQKSTSQIKLNQEISGNKINIDMTVYGEMSYLVKSIEEDYYNMDVAYESMSLEMKMPNMTMKFNSEDQGGDNVFSNILGGLLHKAFQIKLTKNGKVLEVKGVDEVFGSMFDKFPNISEAQKAQITSQIKQSYGVEAFKSSLEMMTSIFPENPVSIGDKWVNKSMVNQGMPLEYNSNFEFIEQTSDSYNIVGNSTIKAKKEEVIGQTGLPTVFNMEGNMVSHIEVDKNTGWILKAKMDMNLKGDISVTAGANKMSIPMEMTSKTVTSSK